MCSKKGFIADLCSILQHITHVVCVNFMHEWQALQSKVDSEGQIVLRNFSWQFARKLLGEIRRRKIFLILF